MGRAFARMTLLGPFRALGAFPQQFPAHGLLRNGSRRAKLRGNMEAWMSNRIDPALRAVAERFSAGKTIEMTKQAMPAIRAATSKAREALVGRYADQVENTDLGAVRKFMPREGLDSSAVIIYVHGGGWANCDTVTHGAVMCDLAYLTGYEVLGPEYPLAPEAPYPAGLDHVVRLVEETRASRPNVRIVLAGDSAGANLALGVAAKMRDAGKGDVISRLLLWYGCYRATSQTPSHEAYGADEYGLSTKAMETYWDWYLDGQDAPYGDLTGLDVVGLPPAWLCEAEFDCLASDTRWLAGEYAKAGIDHAYDFFAGVNHGFNHFSQFYGPSLRSLELAAHFLKRP